MRARDLTFAGVGCIAAATVFAARVPARRSEAGRLMAAQGMPVKEKLSPFVARYESVNERSIR